MYQIWSLFSHDNAYKYKPIKKSKKMNEENDFGFSFTSEEEHLKVLQGRDTYKAKEVSALIMPLLKNLMKNPGQDMIKWPNRTPKIQEIIDKIKSITGE